MSEENSKTKYRMLGESGLYEDEDGNLYSASELEDYEPMDPALREKMSERLKNFGVLSDLNDKTNPAYWYYYYDPRYCGPDHEAWMEMMAAKARAEQEQAKAQANESVEERHARLSAEQTRAAIEKADRDMEEVFLRKIKPEYTITGGRTFFQGIMDHRNVLIASSQRYSEAGNYYNGRALVKDRKTGKYGFVDKDGVEVVPCKWRRVGNFSEYMGGVQDDNRKCGYVDIRGRLVIPCIYDEGWPFFNGLARVQKKRRIGMIDKSGKEVIPCVWKAMTDCYEGLIGVKGEDEKAGFIDADGNVAIPLKWRSVWAFQDGLAIVQDSNKRLGFINRSGEVVIPCKWVRANNFVNGLAKVSATRCIFARNIKWVYINRNGEVVREE